MKEAQITLGKIIWFVASLGIGNVIFENLNQFYLQIFTDSMIWAVLAFIINLSISLDLSVTI